MDSRTLRLDLRPYQASPRSAPHLAIPPTETDRSRTITIGSVTWQELGIEARLPKWLVQMVEGKKCRVVFTEGVTPTTTVGDKARIAGIEPERILKTLIVKDRYGERGVFMVVAVGQRTIRLREMAAELGTLRPESGIDEDTGLGISEKIPSGMVAGTCTPFLDENAARKIGFMVLESPDARVVGKKGKDSGRLGSLEVDVSIGGTDDAAHSLSIRIRYDDLFGALCAQYPDKICAVDSIPRG